MEERDLSVLSFRKLMQMLDATLLRLQKHKAESQTHKLDTKDTLEGSRGEEKEKKSEIQVEAKYIAVDADAKEAEETEMKEKTEDEIDEVEEKENTVAEKRLKLQHFSSKETFGGNPKEKVKAEAFQVEDTVDIQPTYVAREAASKGMRRGWDAERVRAKRWEYDKRKKWEKAEAGDGNDEKRDWVVNRVKQIEWGWGRRLKLNKKKEEIEEQGFRVNLTQHSRTGPKSFLAQSYYQQVRPVDEGSKGLVSAITTSTSLTRTKTHRNTTSSSSSTFASDILKKTDVMALKTKMINKPAVLSFGQQFDRKAFSDCKIIFSFGKSEPSKRYQVRFVLFKQIFLLSKKNEVAYTKAGKDEGMGAENAAVCVGGVVGELWTTQRRLTIHLQLGIMLRSKSVFGLEINLWVIINSSQGTLIMTFKVLEASVEEIAASLPKVQHEIQLFLLVYTSKHKKLSSTSRKPSMLTVNFHLEDKVKLLGEGNERTPQ